MAVTTSLEICNLALTYLGEPSISALGDGTRISDLCDQVYGTAKNELLGMHPWSFATYTFHADVDDIKYDIDSLTSVSFKAAVFHSEGIAYQLGTRALIEDTVDSPELNGNKYRITVTGTAGFTIAIPYGGVSGGSGGTFRWIPTDHFEYAYNLAPVITTPQDIVRILEVNDGTTEYEMFGSFIFTNTDEITVRFIKDTPIISDMSVSFINALSYYIASKLSWIVSQSVDLQSNLVQLADRAIMQAKIVDSRNANKQHIKRTSGKRTWVSTRA